MEKYFGHSARRRKKWELLRDHIGPVAHQAANHASAWGGDAEAHAAGLLHDLGKYSPLFTARLLGEESGLDHWSAGAWAALRGYGQCGIAAALAIQGHHIGLQVGSKNGFM